MRHNSKSEQPLKSGAKSEQNLNYFKGGWFKTKKKDQEGSWRTPWEDLGKTVGPGGSLRIWEVLMRYEILVKH